MCSSHILKFTLAPDRNREDRHQLNLWTAACAVFLLCVATAIVAPAQTFTLLADLDNFEGSYGAYPQGAIVQGTDGNFYLAMKFGGVSSGYGMIIKFTPAGELTILYEFCGNWWCVNDLWPGDLPTGLVLAADGNFVGATGRDVWRGTWGAVYKMTPAGTLTKVHTFCPQDFFEYDACADGADATLFLQATDGQFYGTTNYGGANGYGTVFKMTIEGKPTTLYNFTGTADGSSPAGLVQATGGQLYGTTPGGGTTGNGTVFKMTTGGKLTTLYSFTGTADGSSPGRLIQGTDGNFYGTSQAGGGYNAGTVFKITPAGGLTTLYSFCSQANCTDGSYPGAGVVQATDGNFYGTTSNGGAYGYGTIFEITPTGALTVLYSFDGSDYTSPGRLVQGTDGNFYGYTGSQDSGYCGTIFSLSTGLGPFVSFIRASGKVGQSAEILGQGFTGATSASFNGTPATFTVNSDTYLKATVPAGATSGFVTVTTPSGTLTSNQIFRVTPRVLSFSPTSGPVGTSVIITGQSFTGADDVRLGVGEQMSFTVDSDTQITAIVPAGATSGGISVRTPGGQAHSVTVFDVTP